MRIGIFTLSLVVVGLSTFDLAFAADWGYDDASPNKAEEVINQIPKKAQPQKIMPGKIGVQKIEKISKPSPATKELPTQPPKQTSLFYRAPVGSNQNVAKPKPSKLSEAINCWQEIFSLVGQEPLDAAGKQKVAQHLEAKANNGQMEAVVSILNYWPKVRGIISKDQEQKSNYRDLFRTLLRISYESNKSKGVNQETISEVIAQALGPVRIAIADNPPLTEDSINAYADMACFLYEQKNPGKTIDAEDNRAVFATVIREKYKNAPSAAAKKAMANFAINWYKFKITWAEANDKSRQEMVKRLDSNGVGSALNLENNSSLDSVLKQWQWP